MVGMTGKCLAGKMVVMKADLMAETRVVKKAATTVD